MRSTCERPRALRILLELESGPSITTPRSPSRLHNVKKKRPPNNSFTMKHPSLIPLWAVEV